MTKYNYKSNDFSCIVENMIQQKKLEIEEQIKKYQILEKIQRRISNPSIKYFLTIKRLSSNHDLNQNCSTDINFIKKKKIVIKNINMK